MNCSFDIEVLMYILDHKKYTRRAILNKIGGAAAYGTFYSMLPIFEADAQMDGSLAAGKNPRYLSWYTAVMPSGKDMHEGLPGGVKGKEGGLNTHKWSQLFAPLNDMSDKMSFFRGMLVSCAHDAFLGDEVDGNIHAIGTLGTLTGFQMLGKHRDMGSKTGLHKDSTSLDIAISEHFKKAAPTPIPEILCSTTNKCNGCAGYGDWSQTYSFRNGNPLMNHHRKPEQMFKQLFNVKDKAKQIGRSFKDSKDMIMEFHKLSYKETMKMAGHEDKIRIQQYEETIIEIDRQLNFTATSPTQALTSSTSTNLPKIETKACEIVKPNDEKDIEKIMSVYAKLMAAAFNCNATRVISAHWPGWQGFKSVDGTKGGDYHWAVHSENNPLVTKVTTMRARMFNQLLKELDKYPDPTGGTVLDNTLVHWWSEVGHGHTINDAFMVIGGGAKHIKMGESFIDKGHHHRLLTSIANAMGLNIDGYGDIAQYGGGKLPARMLNM